MKIIKSAVSLVGIGIIVFLVGCGSSTSDAVVVLDENVTVLENNVSVLTQEQKYSLAYMWNEERLAHDVYMNLYAINSVTQLKNIATNGELKHIDLVSNVVKQYDLNVTNLIDYKEHYSKAELDAMPSGVYGIEVLQDLYDALYSAGVASNQSSLEVGCKVEVTDVDDLDKYINEAGVNMTLVDMFNILRTDSYKHYWTFDDGLKKLGITDGCCSLGETFCKTTTEFSVAP